MVGAVQETVAVVFPAIALAPVGAPGTVEEVVGVIGATGVTELEADEATDAPALLVAVTVKV